MAKKEKVQLTPEELAAKKLKNKKAWARVGAVACAVVITVVVYAVGAKDGHKVKQIVEKPQVVGVVKQPNTTKAPETPKDDKKEETTKAPDTTKPADTSSDSGDNGGGGILDTITGFLGGLIGGIDTNDVADKIEGAGDSAKDFFYGVADRVESDEGIGGIGDDIGSSIGGIIGGGENGEGGLDLGGIGDIDLGNFDIGSIIGGIGK